MIIEENELLIFKAFVFGHPDFEIKFTDFFTSNVIKTAFIALEDLYIARKHILLKSAFFLFHFHHYAGVVCIAYYLHN